MRFSLGRKVVLLLIVFALILNVVGLSVSYNVIENMNDKLYENKAEDLAATLAFSVDVQSAEKLKDDIHTIYKTIDKKVTSEEWGTEAFNEYISNYDAILDTEEYQKLLADLRKIQDKIDVDCLYLAFIDFDDETYIYMVDAAEEDACPPGCIDQYDNSSREVVNNPDMGFPAYITNTEAYGWLVSAGAPVYNSKGELICYADVDISMEHIKQEQFEYLYTLTIGLVILTIILCAAAAWVVYKGISQPIIKLSKVASEYCSSEEKHTAFEELEINTHDEIKDLHNSMIHMEHDIDDYIENLVETRMQLKNTQAEADAMNELAHKDALTGIRNKLAYDQEELILEKEMDSGTAIYGIAIIDLNDLKKINDTYGHDYGNKSLTCITRIICDVFSHSPVFRIGGDEFAVILRGRDYDNIIELVKKFDETIEEQNNDETLKPWEKVSAALGYALYDSEKDDNVTSVFRRADEQMYRKKQIMKNKS